MQTKLGLNETFLFFWSDDCVINVIYWCQIGWIRNVMEMFELLVLF